MKIIKSLTLGILLFTIFLSVQTYFSLRQHITARNRVRHLEELCSKRSIANDPTNITPDHYWFLIPISKRPRFYFSDKYKVIVCEVPKCGSTDWRKLLLILENDVNQTSPEDIEHQYAFSRAWEKRLLWNRFSDEEFGEIYRRLKTYYRIMTVREPLERIVSAYVDKLLPDGSGGDIYKNDSQRIHRKYGISEGHKHDGKRATFGDFARQILATNFTNNLDIHWRPYDDICDPCVMKYDYVAKLETFPSDVRIIAKKLGFEGKNLLTGQRKPIYELQRKWKEQYLKYFEQISPEQRQQLYDYYKNDYELFDYSSPVL